MGTAGTSFFPLGMSQTHDHLENMNVCKSERPSEMGELAGLGAKPLFMLLEKSWQSGENPGDWEKKKENLHPS